MIMTPHGSRTLNSIALLIVCGVLIAAYIAQFTLGELPCPLCLLQRVGLAMVGFGLCLNLLYGSKPHHYGIMLIGGLFGGSVSIRQILLHIVPGTGAYGSPFLGLHYYTWAGICFFLVIVGTAIMLLFEGQFTTLRDKPNDAKFKDHKLAVFAFCLMLALTAGNAVSTLFECGPTICDDPPKDYKLLRELNTDL
jgi:disulfide bond formation protein DsbB